MIKYPYTDFHEMNLDWIVTTFKELLEEWEEQKTEFSSIQEAWEAMRTWVTSYFDNLDVQQEVNNKLDDMYQSGELAALLQSLISSFETTYNERMTTLESRMSELTNLPNGSTSGDAELADIRVGVNAQNYTTAGDAVRGQIKTGINTAKANLAAYNPEFIIGDFYPANNTVNPANTDRMALSEDLFLKEECYVVFNDNYRCYVYGYSNGSWSALFSGWQTKPLRLPAFTRIRLVISNKDGVVDPLTADEQVEILTETFIYSMSNVQKEIDTCLADGNTYTPIWYNGDWYNGQLSPSNSVVTMAFNFISSYDCRVSTNWGYYRLYIRKMVNNAWVAIGWHYNNDIILERGTRYVITAGKQLGGTLTAAEIADLKKNIAITRINPEKHDINIMSRQGEGFGYPDNSIIAAKTAIGCGFKNIRLGVAMSADSTPYCTHEYELANNSTTHVLRYDNADYSNDVNINTWTDTEISHLTYKGYTSAASPYYAPIPKLVDMMSAVIPLGLDEITWELKGSWNSTLLGIIVKMSKTYPVKIVLSATWNEFYAMSQIDNNLDLACIFHYSASTANNAKGVPHRTLRFDCYYGDTISDDDLAYVRSTPKAGIKLGGDNYPKTSDAINYLVNYDVVELGYSAAVLQAYLQDQ